MESIAVIEACPMCHGPIKNDHRCESSFTRMKIIIDSTESDDDTNRAAARGSGTKRAAVTSGSSTKRVVASSFGTKRHKAMAASGSYTKLDTVKKMLQYVIEIMHVLEEKIDALIEKGLKK
ncbi:hypothetical protein GUJ93_ZPchr0012g19584 [Zizania palustris]|uniref:Uncharacterized protein n=1 Tax=Zizania palustris TaxID=103762 RepID=A0A8J5WTC0_ZIZPA|nr:hypothetical protein GUJ93_ZPchr0012g19584 [Zizania palustris]